MSAVAVLQSYWSPLLMERGPSKVDVDALELHQSPDNLLSFLALTQKLGIAMLEITWQSARPEIGWGGTSSIHEALADIQTSFAFKRIFVSEMMEKSKAKKFQILSNEMMILSKPWVREHPNIVQLQGICWDVWSEDSIWPVLVFEKSQLGDLHTFLRSPTGKQLDGPKRLVLCCQIGNAVTDMHSQGKLRTKFSQD